MFILGLVLFRVFDSNLQEKLTRKHSERANLCDSFLFCNVKLVHTSESGSSLKSLAV